MPSKAQQKHVIILGAGASITSGYPDAKKLRLLLMSERKVRDELEKQIKPLNEQIERSVFPMFRGEAEAIAPLFREGGFATVDEFSSLAGSQYPKEVQALKKRLRFALGLHNPEDKFEDSDYYSFIQNLFQGGIFPLREDVAIFTFNYDPYLPFLLRRAVQVRYKSAGEEEKINRQHLLTRLTSGFEDRNLRELEHGEGICLLHLHGMIAWPRRSADERNIAFKDLFLNDLKNRLEILHRNVPPPIVFPWEIIDKKGNFRSKSEFCLQEGCDESGNRQGDYGGPNDLYDLFTAIWKRARKEIKAATKISFVGLSMHEFLNPAFKFLFQGKKSDARIILASKELQKFRNVSHADEIPSNPVFKLRRLLKKVWTKKEGGLCSDGMVAVGKREMFEEFIQHEMD